MPTDCHGQCDVISVVEEFMVGVAGIEAIIRGHSHAVVHAVLTLTYCLHTGILLSRHRSPRSGSHVAYLGGVDEIRSSAMVNLTRSPFDYVYVL